MFLRVSLILSGAALVAVPWWIVIGSMHDWRHAFGYLLLGSLTFVGAFLVYVGTLGSKGSVNRVGGSINHELFIVFLIAAFPIAELIKWVRKK